MDSRKLILLLGALVVAAVTAFAARTLVAGSAAPQADAMVPVTSAPVIQGPEVLVATRPLPIGTILDASALKFQPWPKELVDGAYYLKERTDLKALQGTVVRNAITAGQPVTQGALVKPGDRGFLAAALGPGMRAVTVPVSTQTSVGGFVFPGDRIDLVLTQEVAGGGDGPPLKVSETMIRNLRVLATDQRTDNRPGEDGTMQVATFSTVTLESTPKMAEQIAVAQEVGKLSLSLRSIADNSAELEEAIASGAVTVPDGDPKAERAMLRMASRPQSGSASFVTGADVSRYQRRTVPGKTGDGATGGGSATSAVATAGPVVRVARGNNMTAVPVGGSKMRLSTILACTAAGAAMLGAAPAPFAPAAAQAQRAAVSGQGAIVQVNTGRGRLVTLARPMSDLFIADDSIADVQVRSPTQLYIFGKKPGETTVSATAKGGGVVYASTVRVGNNYDSIGAMLTLAMPESKIVATPMNGLVLLTGTVAGPSDAAEAERLVQAFVGEGTQVLSRLRTATPLQVNLQVRVAEVSRNYFKNIGVNLASFDGTSGFRFGVGQGRGASPQFAPGGGGLFTGGTEASTGTSLVTAAGIGTTLGLGGRLLGVDLLGAIDLGESIGEVTTLANPNLTALSGETATFLAGGEIPIPLAQGLGAIGVEYKQYGISLSYSPTVLSDGRISLRVRPEVSQLDYANAVTLAGARVPGLTSRRVESTVELGSGQSLMIGGLLQNNRSNTVSKAPFLGDIPILGALFRSNGWQRNETELVIIITPYLVKPVDSQAQIALPTDGFRALSDPERVVTGMLSTGQSGEKRPVATMAPPVAVGPALGASAPVPVQPSTPIAPSRSAAADKHRKSVGPQPGFSN